MSSPDDPRDSEREDSEDATAPSADEVADPALQAEIGNPAASNTPSGQSATPGSTTTAADREPLAAPGAPDELSSDEVPPQGTGDTEGVDEAESEAGPPADQSPGAEPEPGDRVGTGGGDTPSVVPEQPEASAPAQAKDALAAEVSGAREEKAAQAEESAVSEEPPSPGEAEAAKTEPGEAGVTDDGRQGMLDTLASHLGDDLVDSHLMAGTDVWVRVRSAAWRRAAEVCRDELGLAYFCYLSAIDWLPSPFGTSQESPDEAGDADEEPEAPADPADLEHGVTGGDTRYQLLARLASVTSHLGLTLKADLPDDTLSVASLVPVYPGADWHEREAWEMYGIDFAGHPGLVHLYLPGAFEGHPLRKDFPLLARHVKPWPGLVDVEAMPGEDAPAGDSDEPAETAETEGQ